MKIHEQLIFLAMTIAVIIVLMSIPGTAKASNDTKCSIACSNLHDGGRNYCATSSRCFLQDHYNVNVYFKCMYGPGAPYEEKAIPFKTLSEEADFYRRKTNQCQVVR